MRSTPPVARCRFRDGGLRSGKSARSGSGIRCRRYGAPTRSARRRLLAETPREVGASFDRDGSAPSTLNIARNGEPGGRRVLEDGSVVPTSVHQRQRPHGDSGAIRRCWRRTATGVARSGELGRESEGVRLDLLENARAWSICRNTAAVVHLGTTQSRDRGHRLPHRKPSRWTGAPHEPPGHGARSVSSARMVRGCFAGREHSSTG